jgi:voltage-gated potassium channel
MSILILDDQNYFRGVDALLVAILFVVWIAFWVDFFIRLNLSKHKLHFLRHNIIDLVSLIIPFARPFLLLVYLSRLKIFRGGEGRNIRARVVVYLVSFAILYSYVLSLFVYAAERNAPGATINSYGNSVWWAIVTLTTVGYGDVAPITIPGRIYATLLMLGGMLIVGAITGLVVSWFGEMVNTAHKRQLQQRRHHESHDAPTDTK